MPQQTGATDVHGIDEPPEAAVLLCQGGEGDRRRVALDPAPQFLDARHLGNGHG
jgi:hypothetical protein